MEAIEFGKTTNGLSIPAFRFRENGPKILIMGGVHGGEVEGVQCSHMLLHKLLGDWKYELDLTLVPSLNLDGVLAQTRLNANGVDLNRNLGTEDWEATAQNERYQPGPKPNSESENLAIIHFIKSEKPSFIISLHSYKKTLLNVNGDCKEEAKAISSITKQPIEESMGYPTPGCLGTYAGLERKIPTITYEILRGMEPKKILDTHVPALLLGIEVMNERFKK